MWLEVQWLEQHKMAGSKNQSFVPQFDQSPEKISEGLFMLLIFRQGGQKNISNGRQRGDS